MTVTRAESVYGVHLRLRPLWITIEAVNPHGTIHHFRSDASAVAAVPDRPQYVPIDDLGPMTEIEIATEKDHASIPEETDRDRDHEEDPVREIRDEVAVVIVAETGTDTERVAGTIQGQPLMNPMSWRNTEREQGQ